MLDFVTVSDPFVRAAVIAGIICLGLALALLAAIVTLRLVNRLEQRRQERFVGRWRPVLAAYALGERELRPPPLPRRDHARILQLWNAHYEILRGSSVNQGLGDLAANLQLERIAHRLLARGKLSQQLLAATALGHLQEGSAIAVLLPRTAHPNPLLSLAATRALLNIDAPALLPELIPRMTARSDWPERRLATMLQDLGPRVVTAPLLAALPQLQPEQRPRLMRLLHTADQSRVQHLVRELLLTEADPDLLASALDLLQDPRGLPAVRELIGHASYFVRVRAARALGRIGEEEDVARLVTLLADPNWWVRYRTAQALATFPGLDRGRLVALRATLEDRFAREILGQALAEQT